jgi:HD-GYP domain-containing protein (c-di-GMP phosphodiesterase class II)
MERFFTKLFRRQPSEKAMGLPRTFRLYLVIHFVLALSIIYLCVRAAPGFNYQIGLLPILGGTNLSLVLGVAFWTGFTILASYRLVTLPRGDKMSMAIATELAAAILGGPLIGAFVAFFGTIEVRELKGEVKWYTFIFDHFNLAASAAAAGLSATLWINNATPLTSFLGVLLAAGIYYLVNITGVAFFFITKKACSFHKAFLGDIHVVGYTLFTLAPLAWILVFLYTQAGFWATCLMALPLYAVWLAARRFAEMREGFISTIKALSHAIEARDTFTSGHSTRVSEVAISIGKAMKLPEEDLEKLEWAGILHDVGKIGVPDAVLMKPGFLTEAERQLIQEHPDMGAGIVNPIKMLASEVPIIRCHHERYDGKGYPEGLSGEEIPLLSRVMAVADSFDAMTSQRPYRMVPLTIEQAVAEIRKQAGAQFDPAVVEAFLQTDWAQGRIDERRFVGEAMNIADLSSGAARRTLGHQLTSELEEAAAHERENPQVHPDNHSQRHAA